MPSWGCAARSSCAELGLGVPGDGFHAANSGFRKLKRKSRLLCEIILGLAIEIKDLKFPNEASFEVFISCSE